MTTATTVNVQFQLRADTAANWTAENPILLANEFALETDTKKLKVGDGTTAWTSLAYFPSIVTGGTVLGNLEIGSTGTLTFEGSTVNGFETTLAVTDPTADRTITLPDQSGTVVVSGNASIVDADIAAGAEIAVSKLANGTVNQVLVTDGTDVSWSDDLTLAGNLTVNGTTTTVNTETLTVKDKNIELAVVDTPTDVTADGGGITLKGATDKTINWIDATDSWTSSENIDLANGKSYRINDTEVLSATTLGSGVTSSSLTSVGTISAGTWQGTAIDAAYLDSTVVTTGDTGTVTSTMIEDGTIANVDVSASAAIAGSKIDPDFGSQTIETTGDLAINTNTLFVDASANAVGIGTSSPGTAATGTFSGLHIEGTATNGDLTTLLLRNPDATANTAAKVSIEMKASSSSRRGAKITAFKEGTYADATQADIGLQLSTVVNDAYVDAVTIKQDGKVGIGTASPTNTALHVEGSGVAGGIKSQDPTANDWIRIAGDDAGNLINWNTGQSLRFATSSDNYGSFSERARIDSSGRLLVGTSSASADVRAVIAGTSSGATGGGQLRLQRGSANPQNAFALGSLSFSDSNEAVGASIGAFADGSDWAASDYPTRLVFSTTADGASSPTERMRITNDGKVLVGNDNLSGVLSVKAPGTAFNSSILYGWATNASYTSNVVTAQCGTSAGAGYNFYAGYAVSTLVYQVQGNGDVKNTNNAYGAISDIKLKENIVDANSQWDDIKALQVRNYNFKEGQTHTQIGLIAQEVELVSPGLVSESPDRDEEGNDLGTVTKSVNYSVLYMKAVKALQEAMERIETLEAKVAALESA